ncbi:MAG: hypothetical protein AB9869_12865 [Verrucomicrobiia bacterium]
MPRKSEGPLRPDGTAVRTREIKLLAKDMGVGQIKIKSMTKIKLPAR